MLAESGRALWRIRWGLGHAEGEARVGQLGAVPVGDAMPPVAGGELRVVEDVGDGHDRAGEQPLRLRLGDDIDLLLVGEIRVHGLIDSSAEAGAGSRPGQIVVVFEQILAADPAHEPGQTIAGAHDVDESVGAGIDAEADESALGYCASRCDAAVFGGEQLDRASVAATGLAAIEGDIDPVASHAVG